MPGSVRQWTLVSLVKKTSVHFDCWKTTDRPARAGYNMTWPAWALVQSQRYCVFINPIELYWTATINKYWKRLRYFSITLYFNWNSVPVFMFAYISITDKPICTKLGMLIPWDQEENTGQNVGKGVLSSSTGEGGSCRLETKHDRRTVPRPKLFVSERRLQEQRSNPKICALFESQWRWSVSRKLSTIKEQRQDQLCFGTEITQPKATTRNTVLGFSLGEYVFWTLKTNDGRRTSIRPTLFVSARRLQEQTPYSWNKVFWVRVLEKQFFYIEN
jgi:hypothetical protein